MRRVLLLLLLATPAFARSLRWSSVDVDARLDRDGNLRVVERQRIVFDGDWNGGERTFHLRPRQTLHVNGITRVEGGREIPLMQGDLSEVDRWAFAGDDVVRWRSRLPTDPPFANRELTYVLDVTYGNVLTADSDGRYGLAHDFGMPQRDGRIDLFTLQLTFDPVWAQPPARLTLSDVAPRQSAIVRRRLEYRGSGAPANVNRPLSPLAPAAALLLFGAGTLFLVARFRRDEMSAGRFAPVTAAFDKEVLALPAEIAGAMWDGSVGAPEVAAVLARMTQEGTLATEAHGDVLFMRLLVERDRLQGYERALVDALFRPGEQTTDTDSVRERYRSSGFDPASCITPGIEQKLEAHPRWKERLQRFRALDDALLIIAAFGLVLLSVLVDRADALAGLAAFFATLFIGVVACAAAAMASKAIANFAAAFAATAILLTIASAPFVITALTARAVGLHAPIVFALSLWTLAWVKLVLDLLRIRDTPEKIAFRKRIASTRRHFIEELEKPQPALADAWFPYVLAFGLGKNVDRWFRSYGAETGSHFGSSSSSWGSSSSSSTSSGSPSWTGGGGAFGGAGASASWAVAAGAMAAGVSAPSSSNGSGGGGGGSSSGGGGGGGW